TRASSPSCRRHWLRPIEKRAEKRSPRPGCRDRPFPSFARGPSSRCWMAGFGRGEGRREITPSEEIRFLMAQRPDGPVFGWIADGSDISHIVAPTFVRGCDRGWFFAHCYRCGVGERFSTHDATYFD